MAERNMVSEKDTISLEKYDLTTYYGRFMEFFNRMSLEHLLTDANTLQRHKELIRRAKQGEWETLALEGVDLEQLRRSNEICKACIHPQTGEPIPPMARVASFIPVNIPICTGMLLSAPTVANTLFWQWINQTYNAGFNYCHGNKSTNDETKNQNSLKELQPLIGGYALATAVSCGLAVGLNTWLKRATLPPTRKAILQAIVPYTAVATASASNLVIMRSNELFTGIPVFSEYGEFIGNSKIAARDAVAQTAFSRMVLPLPILALPPAIYSVVYRIKCISRNRFLRVLTELGVLTGCLMFGFPAALAIFSQTVSTKPEKLEEEFRQYRDPLGRPVNSVTFNKGV